jgi:hypothetical protein
MSKEELKIKKYLEDNHHQNLVIGLVKVGTGLGKTTNVPVTVASVCASYLSTRTPNAEERGVNESDLQYLNWIYGRLMYHDEKENVDYMIRFREILSKIKTILGGE